MIKLCYISVPIGKSYTDLPKDFARIILSPVRHQGILWISDCLLLVRSLDPLDHSKTWIWKCRLQVCSLFVSAIMCYATIPTTFAVPVLRNHCVDVTMSAMASQITSLTMVYSTVLFRPRSKKKLCSASLAFVRGILAVACEFPAQRATNAENVSIWWRHHGYEIQIQSFSSLSQFNALGVKIKCVECL